MINFIFKKFINETLIDMMDGGIIGKPEEVGVDKSGLNEVLKTLENQVTEGLHSGVQLHISRKGQTVLDVAFGESKSGIQMRIDSVLSLWSSGKPWTSVAIAQLWERRKLKLSKTVQSIIPEFKNGKENCTIKQKRKGTFRKPSATNCSIKKEKKYIQRYIRA